MPLFIYFHLFFTVYSVQTCSIKILTMTGFKLRTSGIKRDCSTNCATTTSHFVIVERKIVL